MRSPVALALVLCLLGQALGQRDGSNDCSFSSVTTSGSSAASTGVTANPVSLAIAFDVVNVGAYPITLTNITAGVNSTNGLSGALYIWFRVRMPTPPKGGSGALWISFNLPSRNMAGRGLPVPAISAL